MRAKDLLLPRVEFALPLDVETRPLKAEIRTTDPRERTANGERLHAVYHASGCNGLT
jgi:hypothetical protein